MGSELESYTLEWVVTSSSPVTKFRVEWKIVGKGNQWQSEIAEVKKWLIYCQSLNSLLPKSQFFASKVKTCSISLMSPSVHSQVKQVGAESYAGEVALEGLVPGRGYMAR